MLALASGKLIQQNFILFEKYLTDLMNIFVTSAFGPAYAFPVLPEIIAFNLEDDLNYFHN